MAIYRLLFLSAVLSLVLFCGGCSSGQTTGESGNVSYTPGQATVLVPAADQKKTAGADPLLLDLSHTDDGYFMGIVTEEDALVNIQVIGPDQMTYKYFLSTSDTYTAFPFTAGSGTYMILGYENIGGNQYAALFHYTLDVELKNEFLPFLYPNQYVNFTEENDAVKLAAELSEDAGSDLDALSAVYEYVTTHITYDNDKAASVQDMYLPDIDDTLHTGKGICFDYAALTAAMLRSLSIPARLDIGYSGNVRHAWITVYIESIGWVERAVEFNGDEWKLMDPTFASAMSNSNEVRDYTGDGSNYTLQYVR